MVRNIEGHGRRMISLPPIFGPTSLPFSSTTAGSTPKKGSVALPGFVGIAPGKGVIRIDPVSVCHHVSTIGQRPPPMFLWYHIHASGLIGSPTVPSRRSDERSCFATHSLPQRINARIAVGAVYRMLMRYSSMIFQKRSGCGQFGAPSYITVVAPFASGP